MSKYRQQDPEVNLKGEYLTKEEAQSLLNSLTGQIEILFGNFSQSLVDNWNKNDIETESEEVPDKDSEDINFQQIPQQVRPTERLYNMHFENANILPETLGNERLFTLVRGGT